MEAMVEQDEKVQVLMKVPKRVRDKAQLEAELAHEYGWITNPSVTQLFIWTVEVYLSEGIKKYIRERRFGREQNL